MAFAALPEDLGWFPACTHDSQPPVTQVTSYNAFFWLSG